MLCDDFPQTAQRGAQLLSVKLKERINVFLSLKEGAFEIRLDVNLPARLPCSGWIGLSIYKLHWMISVNPQMSTTFCWFVRSIDDVART